MEGNSNNIQRMMKQVSQLNAMSNIYADNLARAHSNSDLSRGIMGRGVIMQATGRDLSNTNCHFCIGFGHYKNDCADLKAARLQSR